ncbi:hypothetical protein [Yinghuangia sp. YIM S09857]|uniref:hypothetical protein n=1 Tax=Yinghuangia sp. YIM S09857 TaxID=3436929 RepID=UPI003F53909B
MSRVPFASSADTAAKDQTLEVIGNGVYAFTAEGDPNVGAVEGEDFLVCFEALATPAAAGKWLERLRRHTDKPVRFLVLSHYHTVNRSRENDPGAAGRRGCRIGRPPGRRRRVR